MGSCFSPRSSRANSPNRPSSACTLPVIRLHDVSAIPGAGICSISNGVSAGTAGASSVPRTKPRASTVISSRIMTGIYLIAFR